jgi:AcrR family transcriptional regulator
MRNPDLTREKILVESGTLFNTQGYKATSISEITDATGYTKGAIYRHFDSKEALEQEALLHLSSILYNKLRTKIKEKSTAPEKLRAVFHFFSTYISRPPIPGGCPLLNVSVEADDAHPSLRKAAVKILNVLRDSIATIIDNGIRYKQIQNKVDSIYYATIIIAALEGAIMMSKLRGNDDDINRVIKHLEGVLKEIEL